MNIDTSQNKELYLCTITVSSLWKLRILLLSSYLSLLRNDPVLNTRSDNTREIVKGILEKYDDILFNLFKSELDFTTVAHCINVATLVINYYDTYTADLGNNTLEDVALGALLHDIGKLHLMDLVQSREVFTQEERNRMKTHPALGYKTALEMGIRNRCVLSGIYNHHRRIDNSGYPEVRPDLVPTEFDYLLGLIDSFEAMTSDKRPYKEAIAAVKALEILRDDSLKNMFDWNMYSKFVRSLSIESNYSLEPVLLSLSSY